MPCHVDLYPARADKRQVDTIVRVINGKISISNVGDDFYGKYPTIENVLDDAKKKYKTFHYKTNGTMMVIVSPCPKKC